MPPKQVNDHPVQLIEVESRIPTKLTTVPVVCPFCRSEDSIDLDNFCTVCGRVVR